MMRRGEKPAAMRVLVLLLLCSWCGAAPAVAAGDQQHADQARRQSPGSSRQQQLGGPCSSDEDCSLLGTCSPQPPRRCLCDAGWSGADCARADLLPHRPTDGYINSSAASWGGRPIFAGGRWHLFATEIARKCPLILFMNNSMVIRATSTEAAGPYVHQQVVLPTFHHNPTVVGPTPDGYFLIFSIGTDDAEQIDCEAGIPECATDPERPRCHDGTPETNGRISMSYSRSAVGPWSTKVALPIGGPGVPDSQWNCKHNNPSAVIEPDGRILLMYHGSSCLPKSNPNRTKGERLGIAEAPHWNATYTRRPGGPIVAPSNGTGSHEDPFFFVDRRGHYHAVTHNQAEGNLCGNRTLGSTCGAHLFSRDSYSWSTSRTPVYTNQVLMEGGQHRTLQTRQRPQIIFDDRSRPTTLFNGASFIGGNGDLQDLTHTLAFRFRTKSDDAEGAAVDQPADASPSMATVIERWGLFETRLKGPTTGNPFVDISLTALFSHTASHLNVNVTGFYDGGGEYALRFSPHLPGAWTFETSSPTAALSAQSGTFHCTAATTPSNHGPARVDPNDPTKRSFAYADGTPHMSIGSTACKCLLSVDFIFFLFLFHRVRSISHGADDCVAADAWLHVDAQNSAQTLQTLAKAPFNKLRMTVFPKWYPYSHIEPTPRIYPYMPKAPLGECYICCDIPHVCTSDFNGNDTHCNINSTAANTEWDFTRFDVRFFQMLDKQILAMQELGVISELILFHNYDHVSSWPSSGGS
jgi:hypothetical protein